MKASLYLEGKNRAGKRKGVRDDMKRGMGGETVGKDTEEAMSTTTKKSEINAFALSQTLNRYSVGGKLMRSDRFYNLRLGF